MTNKLYFIMTILAALKVMEGKEEGQDRRWMDGERDNRPTLH